MESEKPTEEASVVQERLNWQVACRDDRKVAHALYAGEAIEEMHHLSDAGLLDEFLVFLNELGMLEAFEQVRQTGVKRTLVPTVQFVLLYFLKVLLGGESMNERPRVLLSDLALMELIGFNAYQCENGLTKRGDSRRITKKKQGPITAQCLADNICSITQEEMERLFTSMVQLLARQGWFSGSLLVALDGSKVPTPQSYEGCGKIKQTRKVKGKGQKEPVTQEYSVYLVFWVPVASWQVVSSGWHPLTLPSWLALVWLAVMATALAYLTWFQGLTRIEGSKAASTLFLQPLVGTILAVVLLHEQLTVMTLAGGVLIGVSVYLISRQR